MGIGTERAYALLRQQGLRPVGPPVIVAVIDTTHADLRRVLWHNPGEVLGNGLDDECDGYADDVYGWNFMGGPGGYNVFDNQKEETRTYARLRQGLGQAVLDSATLHHLPSTDTALMRLASYYQDMRHRRPNLDSLLSSYRAYHQELKNCLDHSYGLIYDPQPGVGDHPADLRERRYDNPNLQTSLHYHGTQHGTHCADIIAADRTNELGVLSVADHVQILSVRCVPLGDERNKDVANAIRYAIDHGAQVISMSFGK